MAISVVDLYRDVLPKTNCKDCGFPTCLAFAGKVISEKFPLDRCPHIPPEVLERTKKALEEQYASGKWLKKDPAQEALNWARERASSMELQDIAARIGGTLKNSGGDLVIELSYFADKVIVTPEGIKRSNGEDLNRWEQVFLYNHMAQGASVAPTGKWKALEELPNTVSKIKSMREQVEEPLQECLKERYEQAVGNLIKLGGTEVGEPEMNCDLCYELRPLPRIPVKVLFWRGEEKERLEPKVKLLFDETIQEHLDIESIIFLSERIRELVCGRGKETD
ncbi:MAG: Fe-S cluster protein [Deltaproteobacteria bacterium]|nr:MAG: Fe-S cluster protein [Deltaproteobacteria bacterium]